MEWNEESVMRRLLLFENNNKCFSKYYKGVLYWQLIRFWHVYEFILHQKTDIDVIGTTKSSLKEKFTVLKSCLQSLAGQLSCYHRFGGSDLFIKTEYSYLKYVDGEKRNSIMFPIEDNKRYHIDGILCDSFPIKNERYSFNATIEILIRDFMAVKCWVKGKCHLYRDPDVACLAQQIREHFDVKISDEEFEKIIDYNVQIFNILEKFYLGLFKKGSIRAVLIEGYYDLSGFSLIKACNKMGIPTIEFQHGVIGSGHFAYNFIDREEEGRLFSDYLFTWGEYWSKNCKTPQSCNMVSVGYPLMEKSLKQYGSIEKDRSCIIFYSSGYSLELAKIAVEMIDFSKRNSLRLIFKLHPNECAGWKERFPILASDDIELIDDESYNVHQLLAMGRYHIGTLSTVLYEALAFGGSVFVWKGDNVSVSPLVQDLVAMGFVECFCCKKELEEILITEMKNKRKEKNYNIENMFMKNSETNMFDEIDRIIGGTN